MIIKEGNRYILQAPGEDPRGNKFSHLNNLRIFSRNSGNKKYIPHNAKELEVESFLIKNKIIPNISPDSYLDELKVLKKELYYKRELLQKATDIEKYMKSLYEKQKEIINFALSNLQGLTEEEKLKALSKYKIENHYFDFANSMKNIKYINKTNVNDIYKLI